MMLWAKMCQIAHVPHCPCDPMTHVAHTPCTPYHPVPIALVPMCCIAHVPHTPVPHTPSGPHCLCALYTLYSFAPVGLIAHVSHAPVPYCHPVSTLPMGPIVHEAHTPSAPWGNRVQGVCEYRGYISHIEQWESMGMGYMGCYMGNRVQGAMGTGGMGHMGNGHIAQ